MQCLESTKEFFHWCKKVYEQQKRLGLPDNILIAASAASRLHRGWKR